MGSLHYRGKALPIAPGQDVLGAVLAAGEEMTYLCMGGTCGTCRCRIGSGAENLEPAEAFEAVKASKRPLPGEGELRLACQAIYRGPGDVSVVQ